MKNVLVTILFICMLETMAVEAPWRVESAVWRLTLTPSTVSRQVAIPIPEGISDVTSAKAYASNGEEAAVTPVFTSKGELLAIIVMLSGAGKELAGDIELYLGIGEAQKTLAKSFDVEPVSFIRRIKNVTTRAIRADEIRRYFDEVSGKPAKYITGSGALGTVPPKPEIKLPKDKTHLCIAMQWETVFEQPEDGDISFGTKFPHTAWLLMMDGVPVADWTSSAKQKDLFVCPPVKVSSGIHVLQFLVLQRHEEPVPELISDVKPLMPNTQFASIGVARKGGKAENCSFAFAGSFSFPNAPGEPSIVAKKVTGNAIFISPDGTKLNTVNGMLMHSGDFTPSVSLSGVKFPARRRFTPAPPVFVRARVKNSPAIVTSSSTIPLELAISAPKDMPSLEVAPYPLVDGKVTLPVGCHSTELTFSLGGIQVAEPLLVDILTPSSPLGLWCHSTKIAVIDALGNNGAVLLNEKLSRFAVLDDFSGTQVAPNADKSLSDLLNDGQRGIHFIDCPVVAGEGRDAKYAMLEAVPRLLEAKPQAALICGGFSALRSGATPQEAMLQSTFVVQTCLANGIIPIVVTLPSMPGVMHDNSRLFALFSKELAYSLGVPCMDLYSRKIIENCNTAFWFQSDKANISVPTNQARLWIAENISSNLNLIRLK